LLLAVEMGATTNVANTATYSAWMHTMRLMGGEIGAVIFSHFLAVREQLHSNMLGQHVDAGNWIADDRVRNLALALAPSSAGLEEAQAREATIVGGQVRAQALTLAYSDAFQLIAWTIAGIYSCSCSCVPAPSACALRRKQNEPLFFTVLFLCVLRPAFAADPADTHASRGCEAGHRAEPRFENCPAPNRRERTEKGWRPRGLLPRH
jgi:hypothetical protein